MPHTMDKFKWFRSSTNICVCNNSITHICDEAQVCIQLSYSDCYYYYRYYFIWAMKHHVSNGIFGLLFGVEARMLTKASPFNKQVMAMMTHQAWRKLNKCWICIKCVWLFQLNKHKIICMCISTNLAGSLKFWISFSSRSLFFCVTFLMSQKITIKLN